ncbi:unnamed protein product [Heterosigma akashiwo]
MGSLLLAGGAPGQRSALPNARIMLHQPSGGAQGMASDIAIQVLGKHTHTHTNNRPRKSFALDLP